MTIHRTFLAVILLLFARSAAADATYTISLLPGTPAEKSALLSGISTSVEGGARRAEAGGSWTYRVIVPPDARGILTFTAEGEVGINVAEPDGKPLPSRLVRGGPHRFVYFTVPPRHPLGGGLRLSFRAIAGPVVVRDIQLALRLPDANRDGLGDFVERLMGLGPRGRADVTPRPDRPRTTFRTDAPYSPGIAVPTDAVLLDTDDPATVQSWIAQGYAVQAMGEFRSGNEFVRQHAEEAQLDRAGKPFVNGANRYELVPMGQSLADVARRFAAALTAGSGAVCLEDPTFRALAGYSPAFRQAWQTQYGTPWQPPESGIDARYRSEQLKALLERRGAETLLAGAQQQRPTAVRMLAIHSPVGDDQRGLVTPHAALAMLPALQEMIGQIAANTVRLTAREAGVRIERPFEIGYLEYSSLFQLVRGGSKRIWFRVDPVAEETDTLAPQPLNAGGRQEGLFPRFIQSLTAALLFPQVDAFDVMSNPQRFYTESSSSNAAYATQIDTVIGALCDLWRYPKSEVDTGSEGFGVLIADSMGLQRADPSPSDFDGFYGLTLPLLLHGVPAQVVSLDRASEPGYLEPFKDLFVSYDLFKPSAPTQNRALADWTQRGGTLVVFSGTDAYDAIADAWWRKAGYVSPLDDLFAQMGIKTSRVVRAASGTAESETPYTALLTGDGAEHRLKNRRLYTLDLTRFAQPNGSVSVRFEDVTPQDGWGAYLISAELRIGGRLAASFRAGSELESRFLAEEQGTTFNGEARAADGPAYWVYRFNNLPHDNTSITLTVDLGNGFLVRARPSPPNGPLLTAVGNSFDRTIDRLRIPPLYPITAYAPSPGATPLYGIAGEPTPVIWEVPVGKGALVYVGIAPGYLSANEQSARWLRALAARLRRRTHTAFHEQNYVLARRGPYTAVHALGKEYLVDGRFVDLLDPNLPVVEDPTVPAQSAALLLNAGSTRGDPRVLAVSGRLRARAEQERTTAFLVQAPAGTQGVARLWAGKRHLQGLKAFTVFGRPLAVTAVAEGDTLRVLYPNDPTGVVVRVGWQ